MSNFILRLAASWGYPWIISALAQYLKQDKALVAALKKYRAGGTFKDACRAYAEQTPQITDDQIVAAIDKLVRDLTVISLSQLNRENEILVMAGSTPIPDFDGDPSDDVSVSDELGQLIDKIVADE